jgi:O-antigen ligase
MGLQPASAQGQQQELIIAFVAMILAVVGILLFVQERLIYYLIGFLSFAAVAWCQFSTRRWVFLAFMSMPLSPSVPLYRIKYMVSAELSDFVVIITIFVFVLNFVLGQVKRKYWDAYLTLPIFLFLLAQIISSFTSFYVHYDKFLIFNALAHLVKWGIYVMLYLVIYKSFYEEQDFINLLRVIIVAFSIGGMVAFVRYATSPVYVGPWINRAGGVFEGVNSFGVMLALILVFVFNLILAGQTKRLMPKYALFTMWGLMFISMIATFSRTAWVGFFGSLVALTFIRGHRYTAVLFIGASLGMFLLFGKPAEKRVENTFEEQAWSTLPVDIGGRENIWRTAMQNIAEYPLTGVGYSNFSQYVMGTTPHNQYIAILGETGLLGIITLIFFIYRLLRANIFLIRNQSDPFFHACAIGSLNVIIVMLVVSFTAEYLAIGVGMALMMTFYACSRVTFQMTREREILERASERQATLGYKYLTAR